MALLALSVFAQTKPLGIGRPATAEEIARVNLTVYPNGRGLPKGHGTAKTGAPIYKEKCAECHNDRGEGREAQYPALAGGIGSLATAKPVKTVGSYWPYATTVFDYIRRAMPFDHPRSLSTDEVYSVTAFVLQLNGIVTESQELNEKSLPSVVMPNRNGFLTVPDPFIRPAKR
ncbi:c-type cytochrome [Bryobacter aggregatus]|uniref:c-type cytochrome n=1 Tax=Bryobacter aggregatus TaxID=360054 RepID=UPI000AAB452A|nr:cytochrome c [Bryobacter aggregatus]